MEMGRRLGDHNPPPRPPPLPATSFCSLPPASRCHREGLIPHLACNSASFSDQGSRMKPSQDSRCRSGLKDRATLLPEASPSLWGGGRTTDQPLLKKWAHFIPGSNRQLGRPHLLWASVSSPHNRCWRQGAFRHLKSPVCGGLSGDRKQLGGSKWAMVGVRRPDTEQHRIFQSVRHCGHR